MPRAQLSAGGGKGLKNVYSFHLQTMGWKVLGNDGTSRGQPPGEDGPRQVREKGEAVVGNRV